MRRGRFLLIGALAVVLSLGVPPAPAPSNAQPLAPSVIRLQSFSFDPLQGEPAIAAANRSVAQPGQPTLFLLQFVGPTQEAWKAQVVALGATLHGYIPDNAFIVRLDPAQLPAARRLPFVRWVGAYHPAYRIAPAVQRLGSDAPRELIVQLLPTVDRARFDVAVRALGGSVAWPPSPTTPPRARIAIAPAQVAALAALDGVLWVELAPSVAQPRDDRAAKIIGVARTDVGVNGVRERLGLYGNGQIVSVVDSGASRTHPDYADRIVASQCFGRRGPDNSFTNCPPENLTGLDGHGAHVVGSIASSGVMSGAVTATNSYTNTPAGMAPRARIVDQNIHTATGAYNPGLSLAQLHQAAYDLGARISNNSWGSTISRNPTNVGVYSDQAQELDQVAWQLKDFLIVYAGGNDGRDCWTNAQQPVVAAGGDESACETADGIVDLRTIVSETNAKNIVVVGASENNRPEATAAWQELYGSFPAAPIDTDLIANNPNGVVAFSSRGPANDGRILPTIVAPGSVIMSARTQDMVFSTTITSATSMNPAFVPPDTTGTQLWTFQTGSGRGTGNYYRQHFTAFSATAITDTTQLRMPAPVDTRLVGQRVRVTFYARWNMDANARGALFQSNNAAVAIPNVAPSTSSPGATAPGTGDWTPIAMTIQPPTPTTTQIGFAIAVSATVPTTAWLEIADIRIQPTGDFLMSALGETAFESQPDRHYIAVSGTSMAAPVATGAATLIREWLTGTRGVASPSAALMKALLVNGATSAGLDGGQYGAGARREIPPTFPNNVVGFGRVNLIESIAPDAPRTVLFYDRDNRDAARPGIAAGQTQTFTVNLRAGGPFRVTLAWTDYPSELTAARNLVNDLDLVVTGPDGAVYIGNLGAYPQGNGAILNAARANCVRAGQFDQCNPIETVTIPSPITGTYTVTVRGVNVPCPEGGTACTTAVPTTLPVTPAAVGQPFALAMVGTGLAEGPAPAPPPPPDNRLFIGVGVRNFALFGN